MEDPNRTSKHPLKSGIVYASLLFLSALAGAGFMFSIQEPKPDWSYVQYEVLTIRAPRSLGEQADFAKTIVSASAPNAAPTLPKNCHVLGRAVLVTSDRIPASLMPENRLRLDFVPHISKQTAETDLTIYQPGLATHHRLTLEHGETRFFPIPSVDHATDERIYAAVTIKAVGKTFTSPTARVARPTTTIRSPK